MVEPPAQELQAPLVDWDTLRIEESRDEEGRIEIVDDEVMYELLGFRAEDEEADKARRQPRKVVLNRMAILGKLIQLGQPLLLMTIYQGRGLWFMTQIALVWILAQCTLTWILDWLRDNLL
jgi:hypothetical protein